MLTIGSNIAAMTTGAGIDALRYVVKIAGTLYQKMILDGGNVAVQMRVFGQTSVDRAVALGAPLGFGRATSPL